MGSTQVTLSVLAKANHSRKDCRTRFFRFRHEAHPSEATARKPSIEHELISVNLSWVDRSFIEIRRKFASSHLFVDIWSFASVNHGNCAWYQPFAIDTVDLMSTIGHGAPRSPI